MTHNVWASAALALVGIFGASNGGLFAAAYAVTGVLFLVGVQWSAAARGRRAWLLMGGNPLQKLAKSEETYAVFGLAMISSTLIGYLLRLWLQGS